MNYLFTNFKIILFIIVFLPQLAFSQIEFGVVSGFIQDKDEPIIGATILVKNTTISSVSDFNGEYELQLEPGNYLIEVNSIGYRPESVNIDVKANRTLNINFTILESADAQKIPSKLSPPVPTAPTSKLNISVLNQKRPAFMLSQIINQTAASFISNTQQIAHASDHSNPISLRGLGANQALVMINGKRRHTASLIHMNNTFGRGQVSTDLNAIPIAALKNVDILGNDLTARYGSNAIAGAINLKLNDDVEQLRVHIHSGANMTKQSNPQQPIDGAVLDIAANYGLAIGDKGGFINLTGAYNQRGSTNRMQQYSGQIFNRYNAIEWVAYNDGANLSRLSLADIQDYAQDVNHFSTALKDEISHIGTANELRNLLTIDVSEEELLERGITRDAYTVHIGQAATKNTQLFANMSIPLENGFQFYGFSGLNYRNGISDCLYQLPYQNNTHLSSQINGFAPQINARIWDQSLTAGFKNQSKKWNLDFSNTFGSNQSTYYLLNSINPSLENNSPSTFNAGGHSFTQNTLNLDLSRDFKLNRIRGIHVDFGIEYRFENFKIIAGSEESYGNFDRNQNLVQNNTADSLIVRDAFGNNRHSGAECFTGYSSTDAINATRSLVSSFANTSLDINDKLLLNTTIRLESYSDVGLNFNYNLAARYAINEQFAIRATHSTSFRPPSLQQMHYSKTSPVISSTNGLVSIQETGIFSNQSTIATALGIPNLKQEMNQQFNVGFATRLPDLGLQLTIDAYLLNVNNRIVLTNQFEAGDNVELQTIFNQSSVESASFFANAIHTQSMGTDIVVAHKMTIGKKLQWSNHLTATLSQTKQKGDINASPLLADKGLNNIVFGEENRINLEASIPRTKIILSSILELSKFRFHLQNTYYGSTREATNIINNINQTYSGKILTDVSFAYQILPYLSLNIGANNVLDIYPDEMHPSLQMDGYFRYSRTSPQFDYNGRYVFARLAFDLAVKE